MWPPVDSNRGNSGVSLLEAKADYIELIFDINVAFANRRFPPPTNIDGTTVQRKFFRAWRDAKLMELYCDC